MAGGGRRIALALLISAAVVAGCSSARRVPAQTPASVPPAAPALEREVSADRDAGWPRAVDDGRGGRVVVHQPQIERWVGNQLEARAAVALETPAGKSWGVVWFGARAEVDKPERLVTLEQLRVTRAEFPAAASDPDRRAVLTAALARAARALALDRVEAGLAVAGVPAADQTVGLKNDPPRIIVSTGHALLILVDGPPVLRPVAGTTFARVINTRALLAFDRAKRYFYLYVGDTWQRSRALAGPWRTAALVPAQLAEVERQAQGLVERFDEPHGALMTELVKGRVPRIYVSTTPAQLIEIDGPPAPEPIANTPLLAIANSDADLFVDVDDQHYYVLLSGRWYRAPSLAGAWSYVAPGALPHEFADIPESHPKSGMLASVLRTPAAAQAAAANQIPETAAIRIAAARLTVRYDGAPRFEPVAGTGVRRAVNTETPVLEVAGGYYAVRDAVWFRGATPLGPWEVATRVPAAINALPPSSPVYHVTFARVYGGTAEVVYVGYTPGYLGSYLTPEGLVVYGTGYAYAPYIGGVWVGGPTTFGRDAQWVAGLGWRVEGKPAVAQADVYRRWGEAVVVPPAPTGAVVAVRTAATTDDLYAGSDGSVYRASGERWERFGPDGWRPASLGELRAAAGNGAYRSQLGELQREREARRTGDARITSENH